jgi:hypothetical protein
MEDNLDKKDLCLVCFDEFDEVKPKCINLVECECKFSIHGECWMNWMNFKYSILECPICHKYIEESLDEGNPENLDENQIGEGNQLVDEMQQFEFDIDIQDNRSWKLRFLFNVAKLFILIQLFFFVLWIFS